MFGVTSIIVGASDKIIDTQGDLVTLTSLGHCSPSIDSLFEQTSQIRTELTRLEGETI